MHNLHLILTVACQNGQVACLCFACQSDFATGRELSAAATSSASSAAPAAVAPVAGNDALLASTSIQRLPIKMVRLLVFACHVSLTLPVSLTVRQQTVTGRATGREAAAAPLAPAPAGNVASLAPTSILQLPVKMVRWLVFAWNEQQALLHTKPLNDHIDENL